MHGAGQKVVAHVTRATRLGCTAIVVVLCGLVVASATVAVARADEPPTAPFVLSKTQGLYEQYGYAPDFTRTIPTFDAENRPYLRSRSADPDYTAFVQTLRDGHWERRDMLGALRAAYPGFTGTQGGAGSPNNRVIFDTADRAYTLLSIRLQDGSSRNVLLWSTDHCATWEVTQLPSGDVTTEQWVGHNTIDGPPLLLFSKTLGDTDSNTNKRRRTILVAQPYFDGDGIALPAATLVTTHVMGLGLSSGDASMAVSHGNLSEIVYTETTSTPENGAPTYVATFDRLTRTMGPRVRVAFTKPANDGHAQAGICLDSHGYLHVVTGGHGSPFQYTRSLAPYTPYAGWTAPEDVASTGYAATPGARQKGAQTYLAFVCDAGDTLHIAYRQWRRNVDPYFGGATYGSLSYQQLPPRGWWTPPQIIVVPPYAGYQLFFQQLAVDHLGRVFLSCACISGPEVQQRKVELERWRLRGNRGSQPPLLLRRMLFFSPDHGLTWGFATTADFLAGVSE